MAEFKKILVTGADGFIGSHLTQLLISKGLTVKALVSYNSFASWGWLESVSREDLNNAEVVMGDVRDAHFVRQLVEGCDAVLHLAALIAIPYSYYAPNSYIETNVNGTLNLLNACRDLGVDRFIQASTSEVYGSAQFVPIDESHPLSAQSPYAASKIAADQLALSFHRSFGVPVTVVRPFNTYGPRQSARAVIPTIITQLSSGVGRIKLGDSTPTRDFSFVGDTVSGFYSALTAGDHVVGRTYNLGSGFEISIADTFEVLRRISSADAELVCVQERQRPEASEVNRLWADNSLAMRDLDWGPKYSGLDGFEAGLSLTWNWFQNPANLSRYKSDIFVI